MEQRYWDYAEKERAAFSREQVEAFLDRELMERGVLKVPAFKPEPLRDEPQLATTTWYKVGGVLFRSAALAEQFLGLDPHEQDYHYSCGYDRKFAKPHERTIEPVKVYNAAQIAEAAPILAANKAAKERNEKAQGQHDKDMKAQNAILEELLGDWSDLQEKERQHQRVLNTRAQYLELAKGDPAVAESFLLKVFSQAQIDAADAWFGIEKGQGGPA